MPSSTTIRVNINMWYDVDWELNQKVKDAGVSDNLFTVIYSDQAIVSLD